MIDDRTRAIVTSALERIEARLKAPRAIAFSASDRALLDVALERARGQLLGPSGPVLTVGLAGGTGVGKSTLINALAGTVIAEASEIRPTTRHIQAYHHREDTLGDLPEELAGEAAFVAHDRPELRLKMLVDAPDLDSFVVKHRATTKALLRRAGLVLYVFSPERYLEERTWSILRQETEFSACAAVLNKVDRIGSAEELEQITEDLRDHFGSLGLGDIRIFRICARAHVPDASGALPAAPLVVDDMVALRAFIEHELQASEIARLLRSQREVVVAHLCAEVDRVAPRDWSEQLDEVAHRVEVRASGASAKLAGAIADQLSAVESELAPLLTLRRHEQFWGPFRVWLAMTDFLSFGLTTLLRRFLGRRSTDRTVLIERILAQGGTPLVADLLRNEAYAIQDLLFARGLPIDRWRIIAEDGNGTRLIAEVAAEIEANFDLTSSKMNERGKSIVWASSTIGALVPSLFVVLGFAVMTRDLLFGRYTGLPLLWHLLAMAVLFFLGLQGFVGIFLPGGMRWLGPAIGPQAVRQVISRTLGGWIAAYRADLEADLADLREPIAALESSVAGRDGAASALLRGNPRPMPLRQGG